VCRSKAEGGRRCQGRQGSRPSSPGSLGAYEVVGQSGTVRAGRSAARRDVQGQLDDLVDAVLDAVPVGALLGLVSAVDADVASQVADAITGALQAHGYPRRNWPDHLLCGALAAAAKAMQAGEDLAKTAVAEAVESALGAAGAPPLAASLAARAAVGALMRLTPARHWEDLQRALRLLAVTTCPRIAEHPEVERACLRPLEAEFLSGVLQDELPVTIGEGMPPAKAQP
jgi:hypothetical protein